MAYAFAKAAVIHIPRIVGIIIAGKIIRVNLVLPGMIYTPLLKMLGNSNSAEDREIHKKITRHPVPQGGMGDAFDVAN
jgi:NAD(P)-dependent dehydrogenase (short-subunit alcohol dehydrogenase family)